MPHLPPLYNPHPHRLLYEARVLGPAKAIAHLLHPDDLRLRALEALAVADVTELAAIYWRLTAQEKVQPPAKAGKVLAFRRRAAAG
jgi:hypothetical protein